MTLLLEPGHVCLPQKPITLPPDVFSVIYIRALTDQPFLVYPSEMSVGLFGDGVFPKSMIPLQRTGTAEDMAGCILFLASRAGAYCNGNVMVTDGGRLSQLPSTY